MQRRSPHYTQELSKVSEQLKASNDSRFKLKQKLEEAVAQKSAVEDAAQSEQQRLAFALQEAEAEMQVFWGGCVCWGLRVVMLGVYVFNARFYGCNALGCRRCSRPSTRTNSTLRRRSAHTPNITTVNP